MKSKQQGNAIVSLLYVIVFAIFAVAYAANIYKLAIEDIRRVQAGQKPIGGYPNVYDGLRGMQFVNKAVESSKKGSIWVEMSDTL